MGTSKHQFKIGQEVANITPNPAENGHVVNLEYFNDKISGTTSVDIHSVTMEHATSPLALPSYDGSTQGTHPSVVDFGENPFNGYRYWMAYTPYPNGDDTKENPSILASNDKTTWVVPTGLTNPLETPAFGYYSDTELIVGYDGKLYCYWRHFEVDLSAFYIYCKSSSDGVNWSTTSVVYTSTTNDVGSPCVIKRGGGVYDLYFIGIRDTPAHKMWRITSSNPLEFTDDDKIEITFEGIQEGKEIWHFGLYFLNEKLFCIMSNCTEGTNGQDGDAQFGVIENNHLRLSPNPFLVRGLTGTWTDNRVYRATFVPNTIASDVITWDVWYGGTKTTPNEWNIGFNQMFTFIGTRDFERHVYENGDFTLELKKHNNKIVLADSVTTQTVTIPSNSNIPLPIGFSVSVIWRNTGSVIIAPETGVTILKDVDETLEIYAQNNAVQLIKEKVNTWAVIGALKKA